MNTEELAELKGYATENNCGLSYILIKHIDPAGKETELHHIYATCKRPGEPWATSKDGKSVGELLRYLSAESKKRRDRPQQEAD